MTNRLQAEMVSALLSIEWSHTSESCGELDLGCPWCDFDGRPEPSLGMRHRPQCPVDLALTSAGLPDRASRDVARERLPSLLKVAL